MYRFILLVVLLMGSLTAYTAPKPEAIAHRVPKVLKLDSTAVLLRSYDASALNAYRGQSAFQYHDAPKGGISWWERFWNWFWDKFSIGRYTRGTRRLWSYILRYTFILLGLAAIVFIAMKVAGADPAALFRRKPAASGLPFSETFENIHNVDFDSELDRAVAQHNYRLAVRLLYLKALRQLDAAGLIAWQPYKTNSTYINELQGNSCYRQFRQLTQQFEYIWYGDFLIDAQVFQQVNALFQNFKQGLI